MSRFAPYSKGNQNTWVAQDKENLQTPPSDVYLLTVAKDFEAIV